MKFKTSTALSLTLMTLIGPLASAQTAPSIDEGLKVELSASEVEDLKRWTDNAKTKINILIDDIRYLSLSEKRDALLAGFRSIAQQSANKDNELLMAIVLRRAVRVSEIVGNTTQESELQSLVSLLETSAQKAQSFYVDDQDYLKAIANQLTPKSSKNMSVFAYEYADYILNLAPTFLNSKTEYQLTRTAIGWFGNDLNSSRNALNRPLFSDEIIRISALLEQYPANPPSSGDNLRKSIRNLKFQMRERVLQGALKKVNEFDGQSATNSKPKSLFPPEDFDPHNQAQATPTIRDTLKPFQRGDRAIAREQTFSKRSHNIFKPVEPIGTIDRIFNDGKVIINFAKADKSWSAEMRDSVDIAHEGGCLHIFCVGESVYYFWPGTGGVFATTITGIWRPLNSSSWDSLTAQVLLEIKDPDSIFSTRDAPWTAANIKSDFRARDYFKDGPEYIMTGFSTIAKTSGCYNGLCVGDKVSHKNRFSGQIVGLFVSPAIQGNKTLNELSKEFVPKILIKNTSEQQPIFEIVRAIPSDFVVTK